MENGGISMKSLSEEIKDTQKNDDGSITETTYVNDKVTKTVTTVKNSDGSITVTPVINQEVNDMSMMDLLTVVNSDLVRPLNEGGVKIVKSVQRGISKGGIYYGILLCSN